MKKRYDFVVVGGGIVGCSLGREILKRFPKMSVAILDKENDVAKHQSGHNSGVIHAGIYYVPGSLKAQLCVRGLQLSYKYFEERQIPYKKCGKLIVAVDNSEVENLMALYDRGLKNNVKDLELIEGQERIAEFEPHCKFFSFSGIRAIWSPHTGIVDWALVTKEYAKEIQELGGDLHMNSKVVGFRMLSEATNEGSENLYPLSISCKTKGDIQCKYAVTCGGLQSDRIAKLSGGSSVPKIVPFRGEYLLLKPEKRHLVRGNIYPVPDPRFPFLGVHFTPRMNGDIWLGPNAVLAYSREGYSYTDINIKDVFESLMFRGMQKLMLKYTSAGLDEFRRSIFIGKQVQMLRRFIPELTVQDVVRGPTGVRAQALDSDGNLVDDFVFEPGTEEMASRLLHVRNAPSPGATSSLAIAEMVADKAEMQFSLK